MKPTKGLLDIATRLDVEHIIASTVDWITRVHGASDVDELLSGWQQFVHDHCHEDFVYKILDPTDGKEPEVYDREQFIGFFQSSAEHVMAVERSPGLIKLESHIIDERAGTETLTVINRVWAVLVFAHTADVVNGNLAKQEWVFTRKLAHGSEPVPWKLVLWNDWPWMVELTGP